MNLKRRIFDIIQPDSAGLLASKVFDLVITTLILLSVVIVFAVTFELPQGVTDALILVENVASVVFTVEYLLRIWTANYLYPKRSWLGARCGYMTSPMAIIDLLSILPFWLPMLLPASFLGVRALRLVRLLRILKLNRYFDALKSIGEVLSSKKRELLGSLFFVGLLMLVSSLLMYSVEHDAQPKVFRNAFSGLWWAVATLTTVGYGDIYPVTVFGRVLGAVIAFSGIAALAIPTGIVTAGLSERIGRSDAIERDLEKQRGKNAEHDNKLSQQSEKNDEHDRLLREQGAMLKEISERLSKLER